jgi:hypothetical protein
MINAEVSLPVTYVELREIKAWLLAAVGVERSDTPRFVTLLHLLAKAEALLET